ncbi:hypothetical protein HV274_14540 [Enterobacter hormaechei]|nr:hypothetical protein [Enterobacter hormaechei]HED1599551.1 hypothetical protein [Enterobacter hormaechei subsp. hoffmannii]MBA7908768.1 hypothetical protein [Enterobacter hormaechei]MBE0232405.1 hypothetical protein [Enterobacter hormaechei]MBK4250971.1 hypothetical protein [Enterobacter hormaechei]
MAQDENIQRSRLPKGLPSGNPVPMRLTTEERALLEELAAKECRSISSMARMIFLRGMEAANAG